MVALAFADGSHAALQVGPGGAGPFAFGALPTIADGWSTTNVGTGSALYGNVAQIDAAAQTIVAPNIIKPLTTSGTIPPSTDALFRYNTAGLYLQGRPTTVAASVLLATLTNTTGLEISAITVSYTFNELVGNLGEELPGWHAYFSLTGTANSWTKIPAFSTAAPGALTNILSLGAWPANGTMYIIWLDDNAANTTGVNNEGAYTLDNFAITSVTTASQPIAITSGPTPASQTVTEVQPASFTIGFTGSSPQFQWFKDGSPIGGANSQTYFIPSALGTDAGDYHVVISNTINSVTSGVAILTVLVDTNPPTIVRAVADKNLTNVTVSFSKPVNPASAGASWNYEIYPTGDPQFSDSPNALAVLTAVLANGTNVILTTSSRAFGSNYTLRVNSVTDTTPHLNVIVANTTFPLSYVVEVIPMLGSTWQYNQTRDDLGTAWRSNGYDDTVAGWQTGPALFEGKSGTVPFSLAPLVGTTLNLTNPPNATQTITYYFRTRFNLPYSLAGAELRLRHYLDDGGILYLNGQEGYRARMTTLPDSFLSLATGTAYGVPVPVSDAVVEPALTLPAAVLPLTNVVAGTNLLAFEVHQNSPTSSDITFAAQLEVLITEFPSVVVAPPPPLTIQRLGNNNVISWTGGGFTLQGVDTLLSSGTVWTNIPGATSPHTNSAAGGQGFFRLKN